MAFNQRSLFDFQRYIFSLLGFRQQGVGRWFRGDEALLLVQEQVHDPTATHMLPWLAAVIQNVAVVATHFFQSVSQDRQAVEGTLPVGGLGKGGYFGCKPCWVESRWSKCKQAADVTKYCCMFLLLSEHFISQPRFACPSSVFC